MTHQKSQYRSDRHLQVTSHLFRFEIKCPPANGPRRDLADLGGELDLHRRFAVEIVFERVNTSKVNHKERPFSPVQ
jgi:hypothetical protein